MARGIPGRFYSGKGRSGDREVGGGKSASEEERGGAPRVKDMVTLDRGGDLKWEIEVSGKMAEASDAGGGMHTDLVGAGRCHGQEDFDIEDGARADATAGEEGKGDFGDGLELGTKEEELEGIVFFRAKEDGEGCFKKLNGATSGHLEECEQLRGHDGERGMYE